MKMKRFTYIALLCMCLLSGAVASCSASSWYVTNDNSSLRYYHDDSNTYDQSKWSSVTGNSLSLTIEQLLSADYSDLEAGDNFYFKAGTYTLKTGIVIDTNVNLYGGFSGNASDTVSRDITKNATIFDGNNAVRVFYVDSAQAVFDGLTIQNGYLPGDAQIGGSGICAETQSFVTALNCTVKNNEARFGGGVYLFESEGTFINCVITGNSSSVRSGGGFYNEEGTATLINCKIYDNKSSRHGGGVMVWSGDLTVQDCSIYENYTVSDDNNPDKAKLHGGGIYIGSSKATIQNSVIHDNSALRTAGGIYVSHFDVSSDVNNYEVAIISCDIHNNKAWWGGGIYAYFANNLTVTSCDIYNNVASDRTGGGVGIEESSCKLENCRIDHNAALGGGGVNVYAEDTISKVTITSCDISYNTAAERAGGVSVNTSCDVTITNSIIKNNEAEYGGGVHVHVGELKLISCDILNNSADHGVGVNVDQGKVSFINCGILNNSGNHDAGISVWSADVTIISCDISHNTAIEGHGGVDAGENSNVTITNTNITNNYGANGGGVGSYKGNVTIINCNIADNQAAYDGGGISATGVAKIYNSTITGNAAVNTYGEESAGFGGGINAWSCDLTIENSTIAGNESVQHGGGIAVAQSKAVKITNCTIVDNSSKNGGNELTIADTDDVTILNSLIWNADAENTFFAAVENSYFKDCAIPENALDNYEGLTVPATWTPVSSIISVSGVPQTVYLIENNSALASLAGAIAKTSSTPTTDQIGNSRKAQTSIGSVETASTLGVVITGTKALSLNEGESTTTNYTATVVFDYGTHSEISNSDNYNLTWSISPVTAGITISQDGVLTVGSSTAANEYNLTVTAQATSKYVSSLTATAVKALTINVVRGDDTDIKIPNSQYKTFNDFVANASPKKLSSVKTLSITNDASLVNLANVSKLTGLKSLSITSCTNLTTANLDNNTSITSLELKNCTSLIEFSGTNTALQTLDFTGCSKLTTIDCEAGHISNLILDGCTSLAEVKCADNVLTKLDLSDCLKLKVLHCDENSLGALDLDNIATLEDVECNGQKISGWTADLTINLSDYANTSSVSASDYGVNIAATSKILAVKGYRNDNEVKTTYTAGSSSASFDKMPDTVIYYYDTGFENLSMDVTITTDDSLSDDLSSSSGGGCSVGTGIFGLAVLGMTLLLKRSR